MNNSFEQLSREQLLGADYTLRLLHTSPRFRGQALALIELLYDEVNSCIIKLLDAEVSKCKLATAKESTK